MINPFTVHSKIQKLQQDVLQALYTMHPQQGKVDFDWLLVMTGRVIETNRPFMEELAESQLVATVFKIVKLLGGADNLTHGDFESFTSYVNDGGLKAMVTMLLAADKEKAFTRELKNLPPHIRQNAHRMLTKSATLHQEFIRSYLTEQYGRLEAAPGQLIINYEKSTDFILRLSSLAKEARV